jgi:succinoglycan biosynthesis transport protein ExoP
MLRKLERRLPDSDFGDQVIAPAEIFAALRSMLRRQSRVILFVTLLAIGLATIYVVTTPPSFTATATVIIDSAKVQLPNQQNAVRLELPPDTQVVDSQVEILKSDNIALRVIEQFGLTKDPQFVGPGDGLSGKFNRLVSALRDRYGYSAPGDSDEELVRRAARTFRERLDVSRVRLTSIIGVSVRAADPKRAADLTNATVYAYLNGQRADRADAAKRAAAWFQDRIKELGEQASAAERVVVDYKAKNNIVTIESTTGRGDRSLNEQKLRELNSQLVLARGATAETKARLDRIEKIVTGDVPDATVTDTLNNEIVSRLRAQYLELANRETDWSKRYGADHLAVVDLRNQMREIRGSIVAELQRLAETYKSDYEIAKQREETIKDGLAESVTQSHTDNQAQIALGELATTAQTYRSLHDNFVERYMESVQSVTFPITEARLITPASPPIRKSHPQTLSILAVALAGGLFLGLAVGQLRELLDRVFRTVRQVEARLRTDCIAVVPALADSPVGKASSSADDPAKGPRKNPKKLLRGQPPIWHVVNLPFSRFTEAMRSIKIAIDLKEVHKSNKVIAFTSTLPNEGKSVIAASLAQLITHAGTSAILVDCDLRNPSLTHLLTPDATKGFLDLINGDARLEDVVLVDPATGLEFLPQATKTRFAHTDEVLASEATNVLFDGLRERYEYIIVDCSPLAPVVDARATTGFVDSYVYVIEWGRTRVDLVEHVLNDAVGIYDKLIGVVLNKVDMNTIGRYDGHGVSYYHNKHYRKYGYTD